MIPAVGYFAGRVACHGCSPEGHYGAEATVVGIAEQLGGENSIAPESIH